MKLQDIHTVYFLGIGGIGMSALARFFHIHGADALRSRIIGQSAIHDVTIGMPAPRAPALGAIEYDAIALFDAASRQIRQGRTRIRF